MAASKSLRFIPKGSSHTPRSPLHPIEKQSGGGGTSALAPAGEADPSLEGSASQSGAYRAIRDVNGGGMGMLGVVSPRALGGSGCGFSIRGPAISPREIIPRPHTSHPGEPAE